MTHLNLAARIIGCTDLVIVNLFSIPTPSVTEINSVGVEWAAWLAARDGLETGIAGADEILAVWGVGGLTGVVGANRQHQISWLLDQLVRAGHTAVWTVNGEARHPSRWHQYVSDKHGRTSGGDLEDRLRQVLRQVPIDSLGSSK